MNRASALSACTALLAALTLTACGAGDSSADTAAVRNQSAAASVSSPAPAPADASADLEAVASSPVASAESSLAADSRQVAPVMSYAPGSGSQNVN